MSLTYMDKVWIQNLLDTRIPRPATTTGTASTLDNTYARLTSDGALAVKLINKTGAVSVKGELVSPTSGLAEGYIKSATTTARSKCIGVQLEDGVVDGARCPIAHEGRAQLKLESTDAAIIGDYAVVSPTESGRVQSVTQAGLSAGDDIVGRFIGSCANGGLAWAIVGYDRNY